jgi:uncharacterized protein YndB with AHSA1/START domain
MSASPDRVFTVLVDPDSYPRWLFGAKRVRDVDATWPRPGSRFHHVVGVGPLVVADSTEVLAIEEGVMLRLHVRARPFISAVVTFRVVGDGNHCAVTVQEEPALRVIGNLVRPVMDPLFHVRNHHSLRRLAEVVAEA